MVADLASPKTIKQDIGEKYDPITEYGELNSLYILENANRYPGPTGFFSYMLEQHLKHYIDLLPKRILEAHLDGLIYVHKLPYSLYIPYSFHKDNVIIVEYGKYGVLCLTFEDLWKLLDETGVKTIIENDMEVKKPRRLKILTLSKEGKPIFTRVLRVVRHRPKSNRYKVIKINSGSLVIVTNDHPMIVREMNRICPKCRSTNTKVASTKYLKCNECGYRFPIVLSEEKIIKAEEVRKSVHVIESLDRVDPSIITKKLRVSYGQRRTRQNVLGDIRRIERMPKYLVGFMLGDGYMRRIYQRKGSVFIEEIIDKLDESKIGYVTYADGGKTIIQLITYSRLPIPRYLGKHSFSKKLPPTFLTWNEEEMIELISGIIDSEGSITIVNGKHRITEVIIRVTSIPLILQLYIVSKRLGIPANLFYQGFFNSKKSFKARRPLWCLKLYIPHEKLDMFRKYSKKISSFREFISSKKRMHRRGIVTSISEFIDDTDYVYDVVTETGDLLVNLVKVHNCTGHSVSRVLEKGLKTPTIISRPARHFDTYVDHVANYLITLQHFFSGAQAFSSVEWYAGPFIRKDGLGYRKIKQNIQRLVFNLNYPSRVGMQTPFTNFTLTLDAPRKMLSGDHAIYGGRKVEPLGEYYDEARLFVKALAEILYEGDSLGQPFTFPIPTIMVTAKMLWNDPEIHETVFKTAAHRGSFYWLNTRLVDPDASYAMCLYEAEPIIFKAENKIYVKPIKEFFREFKGKIISIEQDGAKWYDVKGNVEILAFDPESRTIKWRPVKKFLVKNYEQAIRIETVDGRTFIVSPDHPILTKRRDTGNIILRQASELLNRRRLSDSWIPILLSKIDVEGKIKLIGEVEIEVDEEFAYFLGLYYGDGTLIRNRHEAKFMKNDKVREGYYLAGIQFSINVSEKNIRDFIVSYAKKLGCSVREWNDPRWPNVHYIALGCARLARTLYDNGISPYSDEKRVPWFIWNSPVSVRVMFLKGLLDSDGYWRKNTWELHIKNKELAQDLMILASMSGISAYLRENPDGSVVVYFPCNDSGDILYNYEKALKHRKDGMVAWVALRKVEKLNANGLFIDIEVDGPHYFVHSLAVISHNCCRISIDKNELLHAYNNHVKGLGLHFSLKKDMEAQREEMIRTLEKKRFGGLWAVPDITGSINVTTINLPRIALMARGDDTRFWELYDRVLDIVRESEDWFRKRYLKLMSEYPAIYNMIIEYLIEFPRSHFNTIGLLGLPEAAAIYLQDPSLWREGSRRDWLRATDIMKKIVEYAVEYARNLMKETGIPWNVEEVPGESAAAKLALKDIKRYPEVVDYLSDPDNPIYSTSIAPYYGSLELPERIEIEARVQKIFTGGVMMHIFLGEEPDPEALAKLTKRLMQTDLVYWSYTPAITVCRRCGKSFTGLYRTCPSCGSKEVDIWSRIIGYYRPLRNWNPYRRREFWTRRHYGG